MSKLIGCQCSEAQLSAVGCECIHIIVEVWPKGYANEEGLKRLNVSHTANIESEVRKAFGNFAKIAGRREAFPVRRIEKFSPEYIKQMSMGG